MADIALHPGSPWKRAFDALLSLLLLVLLAPLGLVLALWIKLDSRGPMLYQSERMGLGGHPFRLLKFRSMDRDAERKGPSSTAADDVRITGAGRVLRRFKLDELPQLINVLRGDMSLVGPRPQVRWAVDLYTGEERRLLEVRPGITDFASLRYRNEDVLLRGSTDPDRDYLARIAPDKHRLGLLYVRSHSLGTDLKILLATAGLWLGIDPEWCIPQDSRPEPVAGRLPTLPHRAESR